MGLAAELGIDQFRPHTPKRVMGWDDDGMPILVNIFQGATSVEPGTWGLVPEPAAGDDNKCLFGDGTWREVAVGGSSPAYPDLTGDETIDTDSHNLVITNAAGTGGFIQIQAKNNVTPRTNTLQLAASGSAISHLELPVEAAVSASNSQVVASYLNALGYNRIVFQGGVSGAIIQSTVPNFNGLLYAADYSADYTDRSLVDKGYVNSRLEVKHATVSISSAEVLNIFTTPKVIVPAPGVGKFIGLISIHGSLDYGGVAYATNGNLFFRYNNGGQSINSAGWNIFQTQDKVFRFTLTGTPAGENQSVLENQPITLSDFAGNPVAGNSPLKVFITYQIMTL